MGARRIGIRSDSQLVAQQVLRTYEVKDKRIRQCIKQIGEWKEKFEEMRMGQIPREENSRADYLAKLASIVVVGEESKVTFLKAEQKSIQMEVNAVEMEHYRRFPIIHTFLENMAEIGR